VLRNIEIFDFTLFSRIILFKTTTWCILRNNLGLHAYKIMLIQEVRLLDFIIDLLKEKFTNR